MKNKTHRRHGRLSIKPTAAQSLAIRTIREALGVTPQDYSDSEIAHLVMAVGLADLNMVLDRIMADAVYTVEEGFVGFAVSDHKALQAVKCVRRALREERERGGGSGGRRSRTPESPPGRRRLT